MLEENSVQGNATRVPEDPTEVEASNRAQATKRPKDAQISEQHLPFLEKVMVEAELADPYDARDLTEIVFRVMRDLMTKDTIKRVEGELHEEALQTTDKALQMEVSDLWSDTNPIVGFISRIRRPLDGPAPYGIDDELFLTRVANEGGLPPTLNAEKVVKAVFSATKAEISAERIQEVADCLPGRVRSLWEQA